MKKFVNYALSLMVMASLFLLTSCGEDPVETVIDAPTVTLPAAAGTERTVDVGEEVAFTVNVTAPGVFNTFIVNQTIGTATTELEREGRPSGTAPATYEYDFSFTPAAEHAGQEIIFDFVAVDDNNKESKATFTVVVNEVVVPVNFYTTTLLYAPIPEGTEKVWFSSNNGETYASAAVSSTTESISPLIDFGYFYGSSQWNATLSSVASYPTEGGQDSYLEKWNVKNATKLKRTTITASEFNENRTSAQFIEEAFDNAEFGAHEERVRNLQAGEVIAFMTDSDKEGGSKKGLIYVEGVSGTYGKGDNIKIQVAVIGHIE